MTTSKSTKKRLKESGVKQVQEPDTAPVIAADGPIDVFVCIYEPDVDAQIPVIQQWQEAEARGEVNLYLMLPGVDGVTEHIDEWAEQFGVKNDQIIPIAYIGSEFQRGRRMAAEVASDTPIYVVADSDCMPGPDLVPAAVTLMNIPMYSEFAVLTPWPTNCKIERWTPNPFEYEAWGKDAAIMEHVDVGLVRFTRKGAMPSEASEWREQADNRVGVDENRGWKYDRAHAEQLRARGWRVGYMTLPKTTVVHLGEVGGGVGLGDTSTSDTNVG